MAQLTRVDLAYDIYNSDDVSIVKPELRQLNISGIAPRGRLDPVGTKITDAVRALVVGYSCTVKSVNAGIDWAGSGNLSTAVSPMVWKWASRPISAQEAYKLAFLVSNEISRSLAQEQRSDFMEIIRDIASEGSFDVVIA